jgi:hypothetical protein
MDCGMWEHGEKRLIVPDRIALAIYDTKKMDLITIGLIIPQN